MLFRGDIYHVRSDGADEAPKRVPDRSLFSLYTSATLYIFGRLVTELDIKQGNQLSLTIRDFEKRRRCMLSIYVVNVYCQSQSF